MRRRNCRFQFWLNETEAEIFRKKVQRSGLSQGAYLRHLINGVVPRDAPPPDYYAMMQELRRIGNNLNQIARKAHAFGVLEVRRYDENVCAFEAAVRQITQAVVLPQPMEKRQNGNDVDLAD